MFVTTTNDIEGFRVIHYMGVARGITVRSRSLYDSIGAMVRKVIGGDAALPAELAERARQQAYDRMIKHATGLGANAVVAMRYEVNAVAGGVTEVLAYGTAVVAEPARIAG